MCARRVGCNALGQGSWEPGLVALGWWAGPREAATQDRLQLLGLAALGLPLVSVAGACAPWLKGGVFDSAEPVAPPAAVLMFRGLVKVKPDHQRCPAAGWVGFTR